jgi:ubiquinone/menaquinone biosynthesis C-methylase UbiE
MRTMRRRHTTLEGAVLRTTGAADLDFGAVQLSILTAAGLSDKGYLIDVGCGSGRLGLALRSLPNIRYMGVDIVPELITFAQETCNRPDWRFAVVEGLSIPESDDVADFVSFLSVVTHLTPQESFQYLRDAARTLKRGGKIVVSFLDRNVAEYRRLAGGKMRQFAHRLLGDGVMNTLLDVPTMQDFGQRLGMETEFVPSPMGHKICVLTKS